MKKQLILIFEELNKRIVAENLEREDTGALRIRPVEVKVLGQMTLLANKMVADVLPLQRTGDLDAIIDNSQTFVRRVLKDEILPKYNLVFDDDSSLVWIPPNSRFEDFCDFRCVRVKLLDPESALVSKAVKAPHKNKQLVAEAIAIEIFPNLIERIEKNGGNVKFFLEAEHD